MEINIILLLVLVGIVTGFMSGFLGVGGAVIVIPALIFIFGLSQHTAQGTSLAFLMMAPLGMFIAFINYYKEGYVNVKFAAIIALSFIIGAFFGSKLAININAEILRKFFAIFIIVMGVKLFFSRVA